MHRAPAAIPRQIPLPLSPVAQLPTATTPEPVNAECFEELEKRLTTDCADDTDGKNIRGIRAIRAIRGSDSDPSTLLSAWYQEPLANPMRRAAEAAGMETLHKPTCKSDSPVRRDEFPSVYRWQNEDENEPIT